MKTEDYDWYADGFELTSDPAVCAGLRQFSEFLASTLPHRSRLADVGGGSGLLAEILLERRPDIEMIVIEPSAAMIERARARVGGRAALVRAHWREALEDLRELSAIVFCRSLYAIAGNNDNDNGRRLLSDSARTLRERGYLIVWEPEYPTNANRWREQLEAAFAGHPQKAASLRRHWSSLERALNAYRCGVANGEFMRVTPEALDAILVSAGYEKEYAGRDIYAYRKRRHNDLGIQYSKDLTQVSGRITSRCLR